METISFLNPKALCAFNLSCPSLPTLKPLFPLPPGDNGIFVLLLWILGGELPPLSSRLSLPLHPGCSCPRASETGLGVFFHLLAVLLIGYLKEQHLTGRGTSDVCATL